MPIQINDQSPQLSLVAADKMFIDSISNRITGYGQIPYEVPQKVVIDVTMDCARHFYRMYHKATEKRNYRVRLSDIKNYAAANPNLGVENVVGYFITLPSYVSVVKDVYRSTESKDDISSSVYESARDVQGSSPDGSTILGINNYLYVLEIACKMVETNAFQAVFGTSIPFHYNNLSHELEIYEKIETDLILSIYKNIPIQKLYSDDLFIKYVVANTKKELKRIIAGHTIELPGGATLNADEICNNLDDIEKVEDYLKNSSGIGDIILMSDN